MSSSDDCSTGVVLVTWDHSYGAVSYTASAQGSGGYLSSCNTTGTSCQFSDLLCGMTYDITLSAQSDQTCSSQLSSPISINTGTVNTTGYGPYGVNGGVDVSDRDGGTETDRQRERGSKTGKNSDTETDRKINMKSDRPRQMDRQREGQRFPCSHIV